MQEERRRVSRFRLTAAAELEESGTRSIAYVTDLSLHGCTLGVTRPPRKGATIHIEIVTGNESFQARATVAHSRAHSAGLTFQDVQPESLVVLRKLLVTAMRGAKNSSKELWTTEQE
jgi:hypothetical protein